MTGEVSPAGRGVPEHTASGELRASHEDRDGVVEQLRVAAGDGRLSSDELDERLERALTARTYAELAELTADLPAAGGPAGPLAPLAEGRELARIQVTSGSAARNGRWIVPQKIECGVTSGSIRLDFTQAVLTSRIVRIDADVRSGSLSLITRPGIVVDAEDVTIGSGSVKIRAPWDPAVPEVLRIEVAGRVRSGSITARPPRRSFWQWLRRAPRPYQA